VIDLERTFAVASDASLVELIQRASRRLVVVSPALTDPVAAALADRLSDLDQLAITVVLDADPEVYRLGYGTPSALDKVRQASKQSLFDLRVQPGVRIGVVISDDVTMLFAPVPMLIEAGSTTIDKPNAIIESVADATGAGAADGGKKQERLFADALEFEPPYVRPSRFGMLRSSSRSRASWNGAVFPRRSWLLCSRVVMPRLH
jgi:hypothetical protein